MGERAGAKRRVDRTARSRAGMGWDGMGWDGRAACILVVCVTLGSVVPSCVAYLFR